jgi:hypothetical protein
VMESRAISDHVVAPPIVQALLAPKGVPKRKSLTGLFGLAIKKSMDRMRGGVSGTELGRTSISNLRSLAEEFGDIAPVKPFSPPSPPYRSRFGDNAIAEVPRPIGVGGVCKSLHH